MSKNKVPPLLIDLDGVLRLGKSLAPGLKEFLLRFLTDNSLRAAILSNTTQSLFRKINQVL